MPEDPADDRRLFDERNQTQAATTPGARQHVTPEGADHQRRPAPAAGLTPRRLRGSGAQAGAASDIYSLGALRDEVLCGAWRVTTHGSRPLKCVAAQRQ